MSDLLSIWNDRMVVDKAITNALHVRVVIVSFV